MSGFVTSKNLLDRYKDFREQNDSRYIRLKTSNSSSFNGGVITLGDGLELNGDTLNVTSTSGGISYGGGSSYSLQPATTSKLGGIIVGGGLEIEDDGTLNVMPTGGSGSTYSVFTGASSTSNGKRGLVPAPSIGDQKKFLCGNGKWETVSGSTIINGGESNIIEAISIDGNIQPIIDKTAILGLSAYVTKSEIIGSISYIQSLSSIYDSLSSTILSLSNYSLQPATTESLGGIIVGEGLSINDTGVLDVTLKGGGESNIDLSNYVEKDGDKVLSTNDFTDAYKNKLLSLKNYTLPAATTESLGGIIVGNGLSMAGDTLIANVFIGATEKKEGKIGSVPTPHTGDVRKFLRGDGYWASIPEENINLVVGGSGSGAVILDAFSYPPNKQGALWMDIVQDEYCLKLRSGDYEYIFKPDKYTPADIKPPTPTSVVQGEIYYLNTVPSTITGGLWYSLDSANHPTLWIHKEGTAYSFNFGYSYDLIAYKGTQENLYSYFVIGEHKMIDIKQRPWVYNSSPVIEKTDFGVYALRNVNTKIDKTEVQYTNPLLSLSINTYQTGISSTYSGLFIFTIDFWLSWDADNSSESLAVVNEGDTLAVIIRLNGDESGNINQLLGYIGIVNTSLCHYVGRDKSPLWQVIPGMESILETTEAKRIHIAITHNKTASATSPKMKIYINGEFKCYSPYNTFRLSSLTLFPYNVGSEVKVRGLYIDHFRIWDKIVWTSDFEPPKPEDYL